MGQYIVQGGSIKTGETVDGVKQLGSTVRQLLKKYSPAQIREIIHLYAEAYGNVNMNAAQVLEEIVCDAMAEMNAFATEQTESLAGEVGRFLRDVKKAAQGGTLEGGQKKNAPGGVKYSIQNTQKMSWGDQIEGALYGKKNIRRNDTLGCI